LQRTKPTATVLSPAAGQRIDRAQQLRVAVGHNSAEPVTITLDGRPIENGAAVDTTSLTGGEHVVKAVIGDTAIESKFEVVATPTGLANLILTSGASPATVSTLTTLLGQRQYGVLAVYANTPAATGLTPVRRQQIIAEARALATR
jgi:glycerophosphoryl diester phosphodiesterase